MFLLFARKRYLTSVCCFQWSGIMFLRIPFLVGEAGLLLTIALILLCTMVTLLTTISLSALATNGIVKGGGVYFLASRSLGPEFGSIVGILLVIMNSINIGQYTVGIGETITSMYPTVCSVARYHLQCCAVAVFPHAGVVSFVVRFSEFRLFVYTVFTLSLSFIVITQLVVF